LKVKNAKNEGSQVESEQIAQTVSLVLQTHFWLEYFYSVPYFFVPWILNPTIASSDICDQRERGVEPLGTKFRNTLFILLVPLSNR